MFKESKELHEDRAKLIEQSRNILQVAEDAKRELTTEENTQYDAVLTDIERKMEEIGRVERTAKLTNVKKEELLEKAEDLGDDAENLELKGERVADAFSKYVRLGIDKLRSMHPDEAAILDSRAQSEGTDSEGGYLVPNEFSGKLEQARLAFGGVRNVATVLKTGTGQTFEYPTVNSTTLSGEWIAENAAASEQDETFAETTMSAYIASSKIVKVSKTLMHDSFFDLDSYLAEALGTRIGRLEGTAFTLGNGSSKPTGIVHGATIGATSASASAVTFDELRTLWGSIDPSYSANGTWMFNKTTLVAVSKLKDGNNNYLWQPNNQVGAPDMLLGSPIEVNQDMDDIGSAARSIIYGDLSKYLIRDVEGFTLLRLNELYAANLQVGFLGFARTDGKTLNAGGNPFKTLRQPST